MRTGPTFGSGGSIVGYTVNSIKSVTGSVSINDSNVNNCILSATLSGLSTGNAVDLIANNDATAYIEFIAEL